MGPGSQCQVLQALKFSSLEVLYKALNSLALRERLSYTFKGRKKKKNADLKAGSPTLQVIIHPCKFFGMVKLQPVFMCTSDVGGLILGHCGFRSSGLRTGPLGHQRQRMMGLGRKSLPRLLYFLSRLVVKDPHLEFPNSRLHFNRRIKKQ